MDDLDLDSIEAHHPDEPGINPFVRPLVAALREARTEVEARKEAASLADSLRGDAQTMGSLTAERDDWRRRYEALRDEVVALHQQSPGVILHCAICGLGYPCATVALVRSIENPSPPVRRACPVHHSTSCGCAALSEDVVARVEGDES